MDENREKTAGGPALDDPWVTIAGLRKHYKRSDMTIHRWLNNPDRGFPQPVKINGRRYWKRSWIEAYDAKVERELRQEAA